MQFTYLLRYQNLPVCMLPLSNDWCSLKSLAPSFAVDTTSRQLDRRWDLGNEHFPPSTYPEYTRSRHHISAGGRISIFQTTTLTCKLSESGETSYLRSRITDRVFRRALRSSANDGQLKPCTYRTTTGSRTFRCAAPATWNCLSYDVGAAQSASRLSQPTKLVLIRAYLRQTGACVISNRCKL